MTAFAGLNILIIRKNRAIHCNMLQHLQPSSLGAILLYCVGEVQSIGSAGGSTSRRTAGGGEQRLTNSAGATRGCVMLYLETRHLCSLLHSEPQWCTYQTAERRKFTLSRREKKDSLFKREDLMEWISRGNIERELERGCVWKYRAGRKKLKQRFFFETDAQSPTCKWPSTQSPIKEQLESHQCCLDLITRHVSADLGSPAFLMENKDPRIQWRSSV